MKDRPPPNASEYTKWLKEKANLELTIADARMRIPAYERHSIISQIPTSLSLTRVGLTLFKNSISPNVPIIIFAPSSISGLALWLDAADSASLTLSGSSVTRWNDKSGNGYIVSGASPSQPTYTTDTISFNGSQLLTTTYTSFPAAESIFMIVNASTTGEGNFLHGNQVGGRQLFINGSSFLETAKSSSGSLLTAGNIALNNIILIETTNSGTSLSHFINGIIQGLPTSVTAYSGSGTTTTIGARSSRSSGLNGSIHEIVIFNSALSTTQRQQIEGYLAWKWGLQASLPSNHPYFNVKP